MIGTQLGKYELTELLGRGGASQVFKAIHVDDQRQVAIKVLKVNQGQTGDDTRLEIARFEQEAISLVGLNHPGIVPVYDFGRLDDVYYMVMALVEGVTLEAELNARRARGLTFTVAEVVPIFKVLAAAVDYAHSRNMVHRDLKPSNIMLTAGNEVMLTDFGVARLLDTSGQAAIKTMIGTPAYMSPEQVNGQQIDARSDTYALGVILYELVTGFPPFAMKYQGDVYKHINKSVPPPTTLNPKLSQAVERVILKALSKNPGDRYQSAGELVAALMAASDNQT